MAITVDTRVLSASEAAEFAQIVLSGAPVSEAVQYFWVEPLPTEALELCIQTWPTQPRVLRAIQQLTGGEPWHRLSDPQRLEVSLQKHYNELSYFLWTTNYGECSGSDRNKADTCRQAIEAKVAGMAGRESPLTRFYHDLLSRYDEQAATPQ